MASLLDRRLVFVTGKGGVGKTTFAAALGLLAARRGRRAIVCEVGRGERLTVAFGAEPIGIGERELAPGVFAISIDPQAALEEYLRDRLGDGPLAGLLFDNRLFQHVAAATPGLREMLTIGKIWELAQPERRSEGGQPYDLVIVDAPASGHGVALLRAPQTFRDIARGGPVRRQADIVNHLIVDRERTALVAVALAEEMPVTETLELSARLGEEIGRGLDRVVVNGLWPERLSTREAERVGAARDGLDGSPATAALSSALAAHARARAQREQLARLEDGLGAGLVSTLPFVFAPALDRAALERLSELIEPA